MSIDEQPMNVYWSGKRTETSNNFKTNYKGSVATKNNLPSLGNKTGDMYNVTESGENFIWNGNSWDSLSGDVLKTLNWQKSGKASAVAIYPVPETVLYPVVGFTFTETPPVEDEKGVDNPSSIAGVNSIKVTRCGKNLVKLPFYESTVTKNGVIFTVNNETGTITANGTATQDATLYFMINKTVPLSGGKTYFLTGCPSGGSVNTYYIGGSRYTLSGEYSAGLSSDVGSGVQWTYQNDWTPNCIIRIKSGTTVSNLVFKPQIELGSTATAFEPYKGADYTIDLNGTCYGGNVDLSTGIMTVTHVMVEPDSLSFDISAHPADTANFQYADTFGRTVTTDGNTLTIVGETGGQIVYNLATPETVSLPSLQICSLPQLDPYTPCINTVYSNQQSVQVGYPKSPQATQNELTNAIISLGGNV